MTSSGNRRADFDAIDLFLADSRLVRTAANEVRYRGIHRVFGIERDQANLLTAVLLLMGLHVTVDVADKVIHWRPPPFAASDVVMGGFTVRQGVVGMAGPSASQVSPFATLITIAVIGGIAAPAVRRGMRQMREFERRARAWRERNYAAARRYAESAFGAGAEPSSTMLR